MTGGARGALAAIALAVAGYAAPARADLARIPAAPKRIAPSGKLPGLAFERRDAAGDDGERWSMARADDGRTCLRQVLPGHGLGPRAATDRVVTGARDPVVLVRAELFRLDEARNAHLERVDFWFDPVTLGVRVISSSDLELAPVATHPTGYMVYGAREGDAWHLVAPAHGRAALEDAEGSDASRCGHAHVVLDTSGPRVGGTVVVTAEVPRDVVPTGGRFKLVASASRLSLDPLPLLRAHLGVSTEGAVDNAAFAESSEQESLID